MPILCQVERGSDIGAGVVVDVLGGVGVAHLEFRASDLVAKLIIAERHVRSPSVHVVPWVDASGECVGIALHPL